MKLHCIGMFDSVKKNVPAKHTTTTNKCPSNPVNAQSSSLVLKVEMCTEWFAKQNLHSKSEIIFYSS